MSRNNSFPPIQKRSSSVTASDLSGEITVDQFLSKYLQLASTKNEDTYVSRTPSPMATARTASNLRRTSIRRHLSSSKAGLSPDDAATGGTRPYSRSEQALLLTERSAVLLDELPPTAESDESMSNGDSARSADHAGWQAGKFLQSPSPDNRRGDKPPAPRRKSLLERWEEVQGLERVVPHGVQTEPPRPGAEGERSMPPSTGGSSSDSQFEDDAYPYHPRINTRGSSQETGFEPTPGDEAAQRPHSGVDSLASPRTGPRAPSSSGTEASSARSEVSDAAAAAAPGSSLFDSGNVETIDDVIEAMVSARPTPAVKSPRATHGRRPDWDQVDRSSHPVLDTIRFPEPVKAVSPPSVNEYERYGASEPRPSTSPTQVLERLSHVMSHRVRGTAVRAAPHPSDTAPGREGTASQRPPSGRVPGAVRSPRPVSGRGRAAAESGGPGRQAHRAPDAAPLTATFARAGRSPAGWHGGRGPPKPPRLGGEGADHPAAGGAKVTSAEERPPAEEAARGWLDPAPLDGGDSSPARSESQRRPHGSSGFETEFGGDGGGRPEKTVASPGREVPAGDLFCAVSPGWTASKNRILADEAQGLVDPTLTQKLLWRHVLKWTAVSTSILVGIAGVTLIVLLLL